MDVKDYLNPAEEKMELAVAYLDEALAHIRAVKQTPKSLTVYAWNITVAQCPYQMWPMCRCPMPAP